MANIGVTVTYGKRWSLLINCVKSFLCAGFDSVVVVNNGSVLDIKKLIRDEFDCRVIVVDVGYNSGSALGFKIGIEKALQLGADFVSILDDDNKIPEDGLRCFLSEFSRLGSRYSYNSFALVGLRSQRFVGGQFWSGDRADFSDDYFLGFHVKDLFSKIFSRFSPKFSSQRKIESGVRLKFAPYGGLFFHRDLIRKIGLPDERFVLYSDDTEFTYRISEFENGIFLAPSVVIDDQEISWSVGSRYKNSFEAWLVGGWEGRAYYAFRNQVFFECHRKSKNRYIWNFNKIVYVFFLLTYSAIFGYQDRFKILKNAMRDGLNIKLGVNEEFPLS